HSRFRLKTSTPSVLRFSVFLFIFSLFVAQGAWADFTHVVKKGETLHSIGKKYHVPVSRIEKANHLQGSRIKIGQKLVIPGKSSPQKIQKKSPKKTETASLQTPENAASHVVSKGETLASIAKRHDLTVEELKEINGLETNHLKVGQTLLLSRAEEEPAESQGAQPKGETAVVAEGNGPAPSAAEEISREAGSRSLAEAAQNFLGVKYRRGGNSLIQGVDCSAYVQKVFKVVGVELPRTAREQFQMGMSVARDALRLGDLVFFHPGKARNPGHVGIYIGNDEFIHSSTSKKNVRIDSLNSRYFSTRFLGARRIEHPQETIPEKGPSPSDLKSMEIESRGPFASTSAE
ncbi:MAG TPA: LysM peptidoglycan-binding domain-containing protein, partial [Thermodesulfobacteriota bacterium]|nr:LysM peptidoglycan-binding domain-containing protein [Thermodesulfobacteriota bacterium]